VPDVDVRDMGSAASLDDDEELGPLLLLFPFFELIVNRLKSVDSSSVLVSTLGAEEMPCSSLISVKPSESGTSVASRIAS